MICMDTDSIIDVFKKEPNILKLIGGTNDDICSTIINYQEIMFGLDIENIKHVSEENFYDSFFDGIFLLLLDKTSSKKSADIFWSLKKQERLQKEMSKKIGLEIDLEFFYVDGECVGIGAVNWGDRKKFPLIHDSELGN